MKVLSFAYYLKTPQTRGKMMANGLEATVAKNKRQKKVGANTRELRRKSQKKGGAAQPVPIIPTR
jgi:hypothetical protein